MLKAQEVVSFERSKQANWVSLVVPQAICADEMSRKMVTKLFITKPCGLVNGLHIPTGLVITFVCTLMFWMLMIIAFEEWKHCGRRCFCSVSLSWIVYVVTIALNWKQQSMVLFIISSLFCRKSQHAIFWNVVYTVSTTHWRFTFKWILKIFW